MPSTEQILGVFQGSETARAVGNYISKRVRHRGATSLTRIVAVLNAEGHAVRMSDVETICRHMDALGLGRMTYETKNHRIVKSFKWEVNPVIIGKIIKDGFKEIPRSNIPANPNGTHRIVVYLDSKYRVELDNISDAAQIIKLIT